jgi:hypothetical protein
MIPIGGRLEHKWTWLVSPLWSLTPFLVAQQRPDLLEQNGKRKSQCSIINLDYSCFVQEIPAG